MSADSDRLGGIPDHKVNMIGDTITDVRTARAAGVPVVLVGFGPEGGAVSHHAPDALLDHFDDLPALVGRLLG